MEHPLRCEEVREGDRQEYRVTGTGSYLPLLPEMLAPLKSQERCSVERGVPNGTLSQDYWKAAPGANSQGIVDVDMPEAVAVPALL
jgi:hypothetical protein